MTRYHTVLFDLDGTLIDTVDLIVESFRHALQTHLGWHPPDSRIREGIGTALVDQLRQHALEAPSATAQDGGSSNDNLVDEMVSTYKEHNLRLHDDRVAAFPGVRDTLEELAKANCRLGVVTSKNHATARRGLKVAGIDSFFSVLVGADDVEHHKPHPMPVLKALDALGAKAGGTLFVGDSPYDVEAGTRAKVTTAAALWGPFGRDAFRGGMPHFWCDDIVDVLKLFSVCFPAR
jgi:pyrophosphatase PpaX